MSDYKLNEKQEALASQLFRYSPQIVDSYRGAVHVLHQNEYPDRLIHFAHSLREVINLLSRNEQTGYELNKSLEKKIRKQLLQSVIDPLGKQSYSFSDKYDALIEEYDSLSSVAHHKERITVEQAHQKLTRVEDILHMFTRPQLSINDEIDEIISNSPSIENAKKLTELQFRWATQSHLIEKLPQEWLPHMINVGFFCNPPPATFSNNVPRYEYWTASRYLTKCVSDYPDNVTEVILNCKFQNEKERNPTIYTDFLACAIDLPISDVEKIAKKSFDERWFDFREYYWLTEKYVEIIEKLYLAEKYELAEKLIHAVFGAKLSDEIIMPNLFEVKKYREASFPMDTYWFEEILKNKIPKFVEKNPELITNVLLSLLEKSIILDRIGKEIDDEYYDTLEVFRPSIEDSDQNSLSTIQSVFVTHIRDCLIYTGNRDQEKLKNLMHVIYVKKPWIFRRLELYIYTVFTELFPKELIRSALMYFRIRQTHHEYFNLIKKVFGKLDSNIQKIIYKKIDDGFDPTKFNKIKEEEGEEIAVKREKYYRLCELEPIKDSLDTDHKSIYQELIKEMGELEHPNYLRYHGVFTVTPDSKSKLFDGKTFDYVLEKVKNYVPKAVLDFDEMLISFRTFVENNPVECSERCIEFKNSDHVILHELFYGLKNVIRSDKKINWELTLQFIHELLTRIQPSTYVPKSYDFIHEISSLIEEGLQKDVISFDLKEVLWKISEILVDIGTATKEQDDYPDSNTDPLSISKDNLNGMSFHVIYQYAVWYEKHSEPKRVLIPNVKKIFDDYLNDKSRHTVSRHAVLGLNFPNFYYLDVKWVKTIIGRIVSSKNTKISFWEAYVSWNQLYRYTFADLHAAYNVFLNKDLVRNLKRRQAFESTIDHVVLAYFYDLENADEMFEKFIETAEPSAMEHCIFQIGRILEGDKTDKKFNRNKLEKLWIHKSFQNFNLERWFDKSPLEQEKTISLHLEHLQNFTGKLNLLMLTWKELDKYSDKFPKSVAKCIEQLIAKRENNYVNKEIKDILKKLLDKNDDSVNSICKAIIEQLAIIGHDYRDLLTE